MGLLHRLLGPPPPRVATMDPRELPIGMYAGQPVLPMTPRTVLTDQLLSSMTGPPGTRQGVSTARNNRYWGTDVVPSPKYPTGPPRANRPELVELAAVQAGITRGPGLTV